MNGARNRRAGHSFEREIAQELRSLGFEAITAREGNRSLDSAGVDLVTNFPLHPQMKSNCNQPNFHKLLSETLAGIVFFRKTEKRGGRFYEVGQYVCMRKQDFFDKFL